MAETYDKMLEDYLVNRPSTFLEFYFLHYENAGELVAKYKYKPLIVLDPELNDWIPIPDDADHSIYELYNPLSFPDFFEQGYSRIRPIRYNDVPEKNFLEAKTRWLDDVNYTPFIRVTHVHNANGTTDLVAEDSIRLTGTEDIYFGGFYLLSNNYKVIKRMNIKTELLQADQNSTAFTNVMPTYKYPSDTLTGKEDSFTRWYFGYAPVPEEQRPEFLSLPRTTPTINQPTHTESRRRWQSLRESCLSWKRVYDKSNINNELKDRKVKPQSMVGTMRCALDYDMIKEFLDESFDHTSYSSGEEEYDIILYPPSMYMYPADSVVEVIEPVVNSINTFTDKVIFEAPGMFKTDGNFHYRIEFFDFDSTKGALFRTSSYGEDPDYQSRNWYYSKDNMETWESIGNLKPTFDNRYEDEHGTDAVFTTHVKYVLSKDIFKMVRDNPTIVFKIHQIDGTLVHFSARRFLLPYSNEIT
ncbi:MAG: hypothetical protein DRP70_14965 [Spirochaetes bacterium]|nr:MAG: hypothetical protein DRP70_14965 [Spirochaetota bacterium]